MRNTVKRIIASAVAAGAATILLAAPALASPARGGCVTDPSWPRATCPRSPVIPWMDAGWREVMAVPGAIYVGRHPFSDRHLLFVTWDNWRKARAYGHGTFIVTGVPPYRTGIRLSRIRYSHGEEHYTRMRWSVHVQNGTITIGYVLRHGYWHQTYLA